MKIAFEKFDIDVSFACVSEVFGRLGGASILGGNEGACTGNRFSVWAGDPLEVFEVGGDEGDVFGKLKGALGKYSVDTSECELPEGMFCCGWIGYFSYDLGRCIEKVPVTAADDLGLPLIRLCFYDAAVCYDHSEKVWYAVAIDDGGDGMGKINRLCGLLEEAKNTRVDKLNAGDLHGVDVSDLRCNVSREYYMEALAKTREYIYDGEVYQINFSQRFDCDFSADAIRLFHWQNEFNPSPYAAFISAGDHAIVSASPEMYITIAGDKISTKPIKGTRRRYVECADDGINDANFVELVESEKDQAELNMIIDLERNDLTRICKYGTIKVAQARTIEAYPTVFHAVATVEGVLCRLYDFCDILRAMFPGGSITGAPKIRSMEIIDELEPTQRSVYTGSIGFIGVDGNVCLNIAIRTVIIKGGKAYVQTGGGIVADSVAEDEWEETITKARALLAGIKAVQGD
ncbi:MAG: anthranilate synthase component I family protein [Phycisphaerae bacterium]|nr:anthranilate synthase component I family protein [Phycisphaerae bacterium]